MALSLQSQLFQRFIDSELYAGFPDCTSKSGLRFVRKVYLREVLYINCQIQRKDLRNFVSTTFRENAKKRPEPSENPGLADEICEYISQGADGI